jgi:hypothetical protein
MTPSAATARHDRKPVTQGSKHIVSELKISPVLPVEPGLCAQCRHASVNSTNRGTAYLRCTRASWDDRLVKYPRLPVTGCAGFEPAADGTEPPGAG